MLIMDKHELLNLLRESLSIRIEKEHIDDYGAGGRPYTDNRLKVILLFGGEQIDSDSISLQRLKED
jgi:hypothetical protein